MVANLIRFPKENKEQVQWTYNYFLERYMQLRAIISTDQVLCWTPHEMMICNERHGSFLSIAVVLNAFLRAFDPSNTRLVTEREMFCADAIILGEGAKNERPLSAHHVPQAIVAAWCVAEDDTIEGKVQQLQLRQLIEDYRETYAMAKMVQHAAIWREAPVKLQQISWFKFCFTQDEDQNRYALNADGEAEVVTATMDEFCCIL